MSVPAGLNFVAPDGGMDDVESADLIQFENADLYLEKQASFLALSVTQADESARLLKELEDQIDVYQLQPYLLNPYLDLLITPLATHLQALVHRYGVPMEPDVQVALGRYCRLLYIYTKVRGFKLVGTFWEAHAVQFLPHDVHDLFVLLTLLESMQTALDHGQSIPWETTYILLLWLSLVALVPFTLTQQKEAPAAERMESIARFFLVRAGKERDAASVVLGNLYRRRDVANSRLASFLDWARVRMQATSSPFETLCIIAKSSDAAFVHQHMEALRQLLHTYQAWARKSMLVDRYRVKLVGRLACQLLAHDEADDRIDELVDDLLTALGHPDTRVRFSAAKGVARVATHLPDDLRGQMMEAALDQLTEQIRFGKIPAAVLQRAPPSAFDVALVDELASLDVNAVSDCTWHGVFLALAECTRRAVLPEYLWTRAMYWVQCGVQFEVRRGASAIGGNVRDACCYVLWAMARMRATESFTPFAVSVAQRLLVTTALDREVSIRRAASAAFQEWVGRTAAVPHGISLLSVTEFAAVGIRRHAYLVCAPCIAAYGIYRASIQSYLERRGFAHWDADVRSLAATAWARILPLDEASTASVVERPLAALHTSDTAAVHGALLALAALATCTPTKNAVWAPAAVQAAVQVSPRLFTAPGGALVVAAICDVLAATASCGDHEDDVLRFVRTACARPEDAIHQALAAAMQTMPLALFTHFFGRIIGTWETCTPEEQQCGALAMGVAQPILLEERRNKLTGLLCTALGTVETRRNAAKALPALVRVSAAEYRDVLRALLAGLDDETTDQRGDVGSWVRVQCIRSLREVVYTLSAQSVAIDELIVEVSTKISASVMERIDSVRSTACVVLGELARTYPAMPAAVHVQTVLDADQAVFRDATQAFTRVMPLLEHGAYRSVLLPVLTRTMATRSETAVRPPSHPSCAMQATR